MFFIQAAKFNITFYFIRQITIADGIIDDYKALKNAQKWCQVYN
jgi:hypothetical protein